jgi:N-carbamoylputrescine amidase
MGNLRMAAVAAPFGRDLEADFRRIADLIDEAGQRGVRLLALPEACLGGYLTSLDASHPDETDEAGDELGGPPPLRLDGPEIKRLAALAGDMVVTAGYCELAGGEAGRDDQHGAGQHNVDQHGGRLYNSVVCVTGDGVLGNHRKVHQPLGEGASYDRGGEFVPFDTPVGRLGMMICYDKAFPESARALALAGAEIVTCVSAWPTSRTNLAADLSADRWVQRFNLFDQVRALENQIVWLSANQSGSFGSLRFVASAKVVGPGGEVLASTGLGAGMAVADIDVAAELAAARRSMAHLSNRRPETYSLA